MGEPNTHDAKPVSKTLEEQLEKVFSQDQEEENDAHWQSLLQTHYSDEPKKNDQSYKQTFIALTAEMIQIQLSIERLQNAHERLQKALTLYNKLNKQPSEQAPTASTSTEEQSPTNSLQASVNTPECFIPKTLCEHPRFMHLLLSQNGNLLRIASPDLQRSHAIAKSALRNSAGAYRYTHASLRDDEELALLAIAHGWYAQNFELFAESLQRNETFIKKALEKNCSIYPYLPKELKANEELFDLFYKKYPALISYAPDHLKYKLSYLIDLFEKRFSLYIQFDDKQLSLLKKHYANAPYSYRYLNNRLLNMALPILGGFLGASIGMVLFGPFSWPLLTAAIAVSAFSIFCAHRLISNLANQRSFHWKTFLEHQLYTGEKRTTLPVETYLKDPSEKPVVIALKKHFERKEEYYGDKAIDLVKAIKQDRSETLAEKLQKPESNLYKALNQKRFLSFTFFGAKHWFSEKSASLQKAEKSLEELASKRALTL
jgi:hypothetical protein